MPRTVRLELNIGEPFLRLIEFIRARLADEAASGDGSSGFEVKMGRRKPTRMAVRALQLGDRMITPSDELDLIVKFFYRKPPKIAIEFFRNGEFTKINILWSNIQAICAFFDNNSFDALRIQVKSSSEQYRAKQPMPCRHPEWHRCEDYSPRTFYLEFEKGVLERSYGKMLYSDPSLYLLRLSPSGKQQDGPRATNAQQVLTQQTTAHGDGATNKHRN